MNKKEMIIVNGFLVVLVLAFGWLTFDLTLNKGVADTEPVTVSAVVAQDATCTKQPALALPDLSDPYLTKLKEYQDMCGSLATKQLMVFTGFSESPAIAEANANTMAQTLKNFQAAGVQPLVIVEPYIGDQAMHYKTYLAGAYDAGMERYFQRLKELGITDEMMGTWVPFPESNTPSWNNKDTEARDYGDCVNKYLGKLKQYFPAAKGSLLLNATTYEPSDAGWENGDYLNLSEYLHNVDKNLVDSFGIQGFPWMSNAQQRKRTIFKAAEFLQPDFAIGAAQILRTRNVWLNTGTFASKYTNDSAKTVHLSLNERKALLNEILEVANNIRAYQQNEYRVSINLFSEDKSATAEATDWSYFQDDDSKAVLKEFLQKADEQEIPVSLYDKSGR